jgi:hypothetical protein
MCFIQKIKSLLVFSFLVFTSCNQNQVDIIASVDNNSLTYNDVEQILGEGIDKNSEEFQNYVNQWVKKLVWVKKAKEDLTDEEMDFSKKIEDYHHTLLKYTIENKIISEFNDTIVNQKEIENYYKNNLNDFELKENVILYRYVKVEKNSKLLNELKLLIKYNQEIQKNKFLDMIEKNKLYCVINDHEWTNLDDIKNLIPLKINNDQQFLTTTKFTEVSDQNYIWLVYVSDYKLKNNHKPLKMVQDKIKKILIYKKQLDMLKDTESKLMDEALKKGWYQINI